MTSLLQPPPTVGFPEWVDRIPSSFAIRSGLSHRFVRAILVLEDHCRARCYCWVGNTELGLALGLGRRAVQILLSQLEAAGWILRIAAPRGHPGRDGLLLLKRANPDLPVASPDKVPEITARMHLAKFRSGAGSAPVGRKKMRPSGAEKCARIGRTFLRPNKDEGLNKDEIERSIDQFAHAREGENTQTTQLSQTLNPLQATEFDEADDTDPVEDLAGEIQARLYHDLPSSLGAADWNQWAARYRGVARDVLEDRLSSDRLDEAVTLARRIGTNKRGARFFGAVRDFVAGRTPRGLRAETPPPSPVVVPPAAPVPTPAPAPPAALWPRSRAAAPVPEATEAEIADARNMLREFGPNHASGRMAAQFLRDRGLDPEVPEAPVPTSTPAPPPASVPLPLPPTLGVIRRGRGGKSDEDIRAQDRANQIKSRDRLTAQLEAEPGHMLAPAWRKALASLLENLANPLGPDSSA